MVSKHLTLQKNKTIIDDVREHMLYVDDADTTNIQEMQVFFVWFSMIRGLHQKK